MDVWTWLLGDHTRIHTHWFLSILFPIWRLKLKPGGQAKDKSKSAIFDRFGYIWSVFNIREETCHHWLFASLKSQNRNDKTCVFSPLLNLSFETVVFDAALQTRLQIPECTWFRELQLQMVYFYRFRHTSESDSWNSFDSWWCVYSSCLSSVWMLMDGIVSILKFLINVDATDGELLFFYRCI